MPGCIAGHAAAVAGPVVALLADLKDDLGARAAAASRGEDGVRRALAGASAPGRSITMIWAGVPAGASFPRDWGGFPEAGRIAVQVIARRGVSNLLVDEATAAVLDVP
jgi:hypothetical protein